MKKKLLALMLVTLLSLLPLAGCETVVNARLDSRMPWNMPSIREESEFRVEKYLMKSGDSTQKDVLLASGVMTYVLEEEESGRLALTTNFTATFTDAEYNGYDKGKTDRIYSKAVFNSSTLLPVSSEKKVELEKRYSSSGTPITGNSYELKISYTDQTAEIRFTEKDKTEKKDLALSGQVFDNEQLFTAMRAFAAMDLSSNQTFYLYNGVDSFSYDIDRYTMVMAVAAQLDDITLDGWKNENTYSLPLENGKPKVPCYGVAVSINDTNAGTPIEATYSSVPFQISENIATKKVLTGFNTTEYYGGDYEVVCKTFYSLIDYRAGK